MLFFIARKDTVKKRNSLKKRCPKDRFGLVYASKQPVAFGHFVNNSQCFSKLFRCNLKNRVVLTNIVNKTNFAGVIQLKTDKQQNESMCT
jgi:hypothetical protein